MQATKVKLRKKASGCVMRMGLGEYKRVPTDSAHPAVGYYVHCQHCKMIVVVLADENGARDPNEVLTVDAFECTKCRRKQTIRDGIFFDA
jgi:hypothetical protein